LSEALANAVAAIGPIRHIVSPHKIHPLLLSDWAQLWPDARLYAPPGLARKKPELQFYAKLGDKPAAAWAAVIDQVSFHGSFAMKAIAFFQRPSRTGQRHDHQSLKLDRKSHLIAANYARASCIVLPAAAGLTA
jgi:hypothetical protein